MSNRRTVVSWVFAFLFSGIMLFCVGFEIGYNKADIEKNKVKRLRRELLEALKEEAEQKKLDRYLEGMK